MAHTTRAQRLRIGVLMGGRSIEREVSFNSGRTICDHIDTHDYDVIPLFQAHTGAIYLLPYKFLHRGRTSDFEQRLCNDHTPIALEKLASIVDFIFLAAHGRFAEDGCLQGMLNVLGIPYSGTTILGSALGLDKALQKTLLLDAGVLVPHGIVINQHEATNLCLATFEKKRQAAHLSYPLLVKPVAEGSSLGISMVESKDDICAAVATAATCTNGIQQAVIVEEKIIGKEFSCITVEQPSGTWQALSVTHITPENDSIYNYEQKYMPGRAQRTTPAAIFSSEQFAAIQQTCCKVSQILDFATLGRIDGFVADDGRLIITDPNTLTGTGMGPASFVFNEAAEAGMNHTQFISLLLTRELTRHGLLTSKPISKKQSVKVPKMRVGVILGGGTNEREVSLDSGRNVCYKLSSCTYEVTPLFIDADMQLYRIGPRQLIKNGTHEILPLLTDDMRISWHKLPEHFDFIFNALHGGKGENGSVQGMLEHLRIPYNGSGILASALCMDKKRTGDVLRAHGIATPQQLLLTKKQALASTKKDRTRLEKAILSTITLPCIIKPHDDGCSTGVIKVHTAQQCHEELMLFFNRFAEKNAVLLEECIVGTELTVGAYGNNTVTVLPASLTVVSNDVLSRHEKFLPGHGENQTPAPLPDDATALVQSAVAQTYKASQCSGYARIDCFYQTAEQSSTGTARVVIIEINTLPALTPATCLFHQAAEVGMTPMAFIDLIVQLGLERHAQITPGVQFMSNQLY